MAENIENFIKRIKKQNYKVMSLKDDIFFYL